MPFRPKTPFAHKASSIAVRTLRRLHNFHDNRPMKVLNLRCAHGHYFEGWFASHEAFSEQIQGGHLACPLCGDLYVQRMPSAPRLNLRSGSSSTRAESAEVVEQNPEPEKNEAPSTSSTELNVTHASTSEVQLQALWLQTVQHVLAHTQDVGEHFPQEARRIHYGEQPHRPIRGQASTDEVAALREEGIELMSLPIPAALKGTVQ
jgi:hypothetical protein